MWYSDDLIRLRTVANCKSSGWLTYIVTCTRRLHGTDACTRWPWTPTCWPNSTRRSWPNWNGTSWYRRTSEHSIASIWPPWWTACVAPGTAGTGGAHVRPSWLGPWPITATRSAATGPCARWANTTTYCTWSPGWQWTWKPGQNP